MNKTLLIFGVAILSGGAFFLMGNDSEDQISQKTPIADALEKDQPRSTNFATESLVQSQEQNLIRLDTVKATQIASNKHGENEKYLVESELKIQQTEVQTEDWKLSRGKFAKADRIPYESYDQSALYNLVQQGDMLAHQVLSKQLAITNPIEAKSLLERSMVYGDTHAIKLASSQIESFIRKFNENKMSEKEVLSLLKMVKSYAGNVERAVRVYQKAYQNLALLRGDSLTAKSIGFKLESKLDEQFSENDLRYAKDLAFMLYSELSEYRNQFGLEEFNNSQEVIFGGQESELYKEYLAKK